jgi:hypothetical protein
MHFLPSAKVFFFSQYRNILWCHNHSQCTASTVLWPPHCHPSMKGCPVHPEHKVREKLHLW